MKARTSETKKSVSAFVKTVEDKRRQKDCFAIIEIMKKQSGFEPKMWGPAIIGFGTYHYKYESGHEGDAPLVGFSPVNQNLLFTLQILKGRKNYLRTLENIRQQVLCLY